MRELKHWQDVVNGLLGIALAISPWVMGFDGDSMAMSNAVIIGMALLAASMGAILMPAAWEEWTEAGLGLWMVVSPWVLGFAMQRNAMLSTVVIGVAVMALSIWTLATDRDYTPWWHRDTVAH